MLGMGVQKADGELATVFPRSRPGEYLRDGITPAGSPARQTSPGGVRCVRWLPGPSATSRVTLYLHT